MPSCPACRSARTDTVGLLTKGRYRLWRCAQCRSEFYVDEGAEPEGKHYWERYKFDVYGDSAVQSSFEQRYQQLLDEAAGVVGPIGSVLDVGCGIGNFVDFARRSGMRAIGTDVSPDAVAVARDRGLEVHLSHEIDGVVPDGSVDALTLWDVVEHLIDPHEVLVGLVSKVRPGGAVLFETPDAAFPVRGGLLALNRVSGGRVNLTGPMYYWEHKIYFTEAGLAALLDSVGVDLVAVHRQTSVKAKMSRQFAVNASKGSRKAKVLRATWPALEGAFRAAGKGNKLLAIGRRR